MLQPRARPASLRATEAATGASSRNLLTDHDDWSAQLHEICGTDPKTFDGSTAALMAIMDPEDQPVVARAVQDAIDNHTDIIVEFRVYHPNGEMRWISTHGHAIYDDDGKATHTHGVAVDVTERKRSENRDIGADRGYRQSASRLAQLNEERRLWKSTFQDRRCS